MQTSLHEAQGREETNPGLIWFTEECMNNGVPLESYVEHAERIGDRELATFFRRALAHSRWVRTAVIRTRPTPAHRSRPRAA